MSIKRKLKRDGTPQRLLLLKPKDLILYFKGEIPDYEIGMPILNKANVFCTDAVYLETLELQELFKNS